MRIAKPQPANVYAESMINGLNRFSNASVFVPIMMFCNNMLPLRNGRIFMNALNLSLKLSNGNHIPESIDWPIIIIDETPPTAFWLKSAPKRIPKLVKKRIETRLTGTQTNMLILKKDGSRIPPNKRMETVWMIPKGITDNI